MATSRLGAGFPWERYSFIGTLVLLALSTAVMMTRSDFFSLSLALGGVYLLLRQKIEGESFESQNFKFLSLAIFASVVVDFAWFLFAAPHWCSS